VSLTFTDIFCGAGGSSSGLAAAGLELKLAANHWQRAIDTHAANFVDAEHLCADVNNYDMRRLPTTDILWASPICTEASPAGGRTGKKAAHGQLDLLEHGPIAQAGFERTRATFHDVIRATEVHRYRAVLVENVVDVVERWELFDWWVDGMQRLGYNVQFVSVSSAHIGDEMNLWAPQWRDRLYLVFTLRGIPLPDISPRPIALCVECDENVHAVQSWKNPRGRQLGKYRQQYVYRCPNTACRHAVVEPYVLPAAAAIDWSDLGTRIGDRPRTKTKPEGLASSTIRRVRAGLEMFAELRPPVMVSINHADDDPRAYPVGAAPLPTRSTKIGDGMAVPPMLVPAGGTWNDTAASVAGPMRTRTARDAEALVVPPFVTMLRNNNRATAVDEPIGTVTTGRHHYLTVPEGAFYVKNHGGYADPKRMAKPVSEPTGTITTAPGSHALVIPYRKGRAKTTGEPLHTVATRESAGLCSVEVDVAECRFRMLKPREHLAAQRFPRDYIVLGNAGEQTMQAGNAVSSNVAQWLGERIVDALNRSAAS
jgi:DNA (cytosine-5)-methyltransferase 1